MPLIFRNPKTGQLSRPIPESATDRIAILEKAGWELVNPPKVKTEGKSKSRKKAQAEADEGNES